jgi:hypothetical protein
LKILEPAKEALQAVVEAVTGGKPKLSREAAEELRHRAEVNRRGDRRRAARARGLDSAGRWIPKRAGWLR